MASTSCFWWLRKKRKEEGSVTRKLEELQAVCAAQNLKRFEYAELKAATDNFSRRSTVGSGGFGHVYRGTLPNGQVVAIKVLHDTENVVVDEFLNEVLTLGNVHNENVVPFRGFCYEQGNRTLHRALVYDYMANGSLQDALETWKGERRLGWALSFDIILGTARGLRFLHDQCHPKIIHRDIKPANILIDDQLQARLADFGLARNATTFQTHVTTVLMGTLGFFAPDYALTGRLTEKSDVYSFGVVVLVVLSGLSPFAEEVQTGPAGGDLVNVAIVRRAFSVVEQQRPVREFMDERFEDHFDTRQAEACLAVGLQCVQAEPSRRPSMKRVVQVLERHKAKLGGSGRLGRRLQSTSSGSSFEHESMRI